jgi:16S rRNA (adenine1518-N6/adenine1519-N6)-dimethyltransferase
MVNFDFKGKSMNLEQETRYILNKYNAHANKGYGQNFLIDQNVVDGILEKAEVNKDDLIIEIGPGLGNLTSPLLENAGKVICIELDPKMVSILTDRFSLYNNFELINDDVLKVDLNKIIEENSNFKSAKVVANT